jgi:hypothetical protein
MRKLLILGGLAGLTRYLVRRNSRASAGIDLTEPDLDEPQAPIEHMEANADIPGGIRP